MTGKEKSIYVLNTYAQKENKKSIIDKMIGTRKYIICNVSISSVTRNSLMVGRRTATFKKSIYYNLNFFDDPNATP